MNDELIELIYQANPWLTGVSDNVPILDSGYMQRLQAPKLLLPEWDNVWLILVGPRQSGKTTLAKYIAQSLATTKRFKPLLYLNCDLLLIRQWLQSPLFIKEALAKFKLVKPTILIDEVQRLENPGLLLKACIDLKLPIKMIATGSSQLEIRSKVQEHLTGRHLEALVLPLSYQEIGSHGIEHLVYGCYPAVVKAQEKTMVLAQIYKDYINKDIIEILKIGKPDTMQKLITLIAHNSGQLVNYNQLATDCRVSAATIQSYLVTLEYTYTIARVTPFVGNKRKEITSNPIFYFIDNGFRNQALNNLSLALDTRQDIGLLVQSAIFQELLKFKVQNFYNFNLHFWRTQSGAEVDFVLYQNSDCIIPIEAKFQTLKRPTISRSLRSFIEAYNPKYGFIITKNYNAKVTVGSCEVHLLSFPRLLEMFAMLKAIL
jgi:predicted AAA+ superfamily ATPase